MRGSGSGGGDCGKHTKTGKKAGRESKGTPANSQPLLLQLLLLFQLLRKLLLLLVLLRQPRKQKAGRLRGLCVDKLQSGNTAVGRMGVSRRCREQQPSRARSPN